LGISKNKKLISRDEESTKGPICPQSPSSDEIPDQTKESPYPGIGQSPILQPEGGPSLTEKPLDRNIIQHSS
jgi:hypothetical protein